MDENIKLIKGYSLKEVNAGNFENIALSVFKYQYHHNSIYRAFADSLRIDVSKVQTLEQIPFLPVSFFKTHQVLSTAENSIQLVFESSKTTGDIPAKHFVADEQLYEEALLSGFSAFYGAPEDYVFLALLPSYLERQNASLVHMVRVLMTKSGKTESGFYLDEWDVLSQLIQKLEERGQKTLLIGVTFALLDFASASSMPLKHTMVMETGGMKGRREEWTRARVHDFLKSSWQLEQVQSEYGMTELLSQAYAKEDGIFRSSNTMQVLVRDINDPLQVNRQGTGCINVIDLANLYSCSFIATDDIGSIGEDGSFEVLGRLDHAALRGCSLMVL